MVRIIKIMVIFLLLIGFNIRVLYGQNSCMEDNLEEVSQINNDSLTVTVGYAFIFTKRADIPYYTNFFFTFEKNQTKYFIINRSNESTQYGIRIFDKYNKELPLLRSALQEENLEIYGFVAPENGRFKLVIYSNDPDNSCASVTLFTPKEDVGLTNKSIPIASHLVKKVSTNPQLELLKSIDIRVNDEPEMPYYKEISYVFTKNTKYIIKMEGNRNLKLKFFNTRRELIPHKADKTDHFTSSFICEHTGIYYIVVYQKKPLPQNMTLDIYKDKSFK